MSMAGMDMGGSSSSSGSMSGMSGMTMVFSNTQHTPLFSTQWTPTSSGGYAGTCIFLVILAILSRLIQAYRHILEQKWHQRAMNRRYIVVAGETSADRERQMGLEGSEKSEEATLTVRGLDERVKVVKTPRKAGLEVMPWRFSVDLPRACLYAIFAGVNYLLMLGVMTMNVGYFLSVLAGLFVGELAIGRYAQIEDNGHH